MNKELKDKIKEFTEQIFAYNLKDDKLSEKIKQELAKLGAWKPYYAEDENRRAIMLIDLWGSKIEEVKDIVRKEARKQFENIDFLDEVYNKRVKRKEIAKRMREKWREN